MNDFSTAAVILVKENADKIRKRNPFSKGVPPIETVREFLAKRKFLDSPSWKKILYDEKTGQPLANILIAFESIGEYDYAIVVRAKNIEKILEIAQLFRELYTVSDTLTYSGPVLVK